MLGASRIFTPLSSNDMLRHNLKLTMWGPPPPSLARELKSLGLSPYGGKRWKKQLF